MLNTLSGKICLIYETVLSDLQQLDPGGSSWAGLGLYRASFNPPTFSSEKMDSDSLYGGSYLEQDLPPQQHCIRSDGN